MLCLFCSFIALNNLKCKHNKEVKRAHEGPGGEGGGREVLFEVLPY